MKNLEIAKILENIADILELQGVEFKPRAYRRAARSVESLTEDVKEVYKRGELEQIPGVGKSIAETIQEIIKTGRSKVYLKLKKEIKVDIEKLHQIPFLGPKKIKILYKKLGVKNIKDLQKAIKKGKLKKLVGFGEKTEETLAEGIKFLKRKPKRFLYAHAAPIVAEIKKELEKNKFIKRVEIAGSFRRGKETVGDLDFLVISEKPAAAIKAFLALPDVKKVLAKGTTKSSIRLSSGMQVDLRVLKEKEFGSALMYFIGSKEHSVKLRKLALSKGYTLSEYGLFRVKGKKWVAGKTEEEIYRKLGLQFIEPELRENMGEIAAAQKKKLPKLITSKDVKGVFHNHSNWSDARNTLLEMAQKAEEMKFKFISFNDHFGQIGITKPLDEKRLNSYLKEINKVRKKVGIKVFSGVEIDIFKDGSLPLSKKKLKELDVVIAAVHLATRMPEKEMTKRVCFALENYPINILGHPTDRKLNERKGLSINLEKVFQVAKENNVFLEINGAPQRMDLSGENVKAAIEAGCKCAISTDAHSTEQLLYYLNAAKMAQRGWAEWKNILNSYNLPQITKALSK